MARLGGSGGLRLSLSDLFPGLDSCDWKITSPDEVDYNCFAWAAGDSSRWWEPITPYYWPKSVQRRNTLAAYQAAYETLGYEVCSDPELERGFDKIALYVGDGEPTHAARQTEGGSWSSKLGMLHDIEHSTLEALEGKEYGRVALIMRRKTTPIG